MPTQTFFQKGLRAIPTLKLPTFRGDCKMQLTNKTPTKAKRPTKKALIQDIFSKTDLLNASIERCNIDANATINKMIDVLINHDLIDEVKS